MGGVTSIAKGRAVVFCSLYLGVNVEANIYFAKTSDSDGQGQGLGVAMIAMGTAHLDEYYDLLQGEADVTIVEQIEDMGWGHRQFSIRDLDGNRLVFFRFLEGGNPGGSGGIDLSEVSGAVAKRAQQVERKRISKCGCAQYIIKKSGKMIVRQSCLSGRVY